ncbi:MAG: hypothetical protein Q9208_005916 [Pyrenodesmia sp. 3 TL-2023]
MSSGFVSGGTTDKPVERDDEWLRAQQEIEANRRRKEEEGKQDGGKSLYEILQNNKAAKQEAFEESIRLKNQFRTLDEDEVEFLDAVLESTRAKEDAVKRETTEQLEVFRRQQEEADKAALQEEDSGTVVIGAGSPSAPSPADSQWAINARKRKRAKENETIPGLKLRKTSSTSKEASSVSAKGLEASPGAASSEQHRSKQTATEASHRNTSLTAAEKTTSSTPTRPSPESAKPQVGTLGLGGYSSDEDD